MTNPPPTPALTQLTEEIMSEIKRTSDVINESLWYVNPADIVAALLRVAKFASDEVIVDEVFGDEYGSTGSALVAFDAGQNAARAESLQKQKELLGL